MVELPLQHVESSDIEAIGYDPGLEILDIKFKKSHRVKRYYNVGSLIYHGLVEAKSKGIFFSKFIRNHYMCSDVH